MRRLAFVLMATISGCYFTTDLTGFQNNATIATAGDASIDAPKGDAAPTEGGGATTDAQAKRCDLPSVVLCDSFDDRTAADAGTWEVDDQTEAIKVEIESGALRFSIPASDESGRGILYKTFPNQTNRLVIDFDFEIDPFEGEGFFDSFLNVFGLEINRVYAGALTIASPNIDLNVVTYETGSGVNTTDGALPITPGRYAHITLDETFGGTKAGRYALYVDGNLFTSRQLPTIGGGTTPPTEHTVMLGIAATNKHPAMSMRFDNVRIAFE